MGRDPLPLHVAFLGRRAATKQAVKLLLRAYLARPEPENVRTFLDNGVLVFHGDTTNVAQLGELEFLHKSG